MEAVPFYTQEGSNDDTSNNKKKKNVQLSSLLFGAHPEISPQTSAAEHAPIVHPPLEGLIHMRRWGAESDKPNHVEQPRIEQPRISSLESKVNRIGYGMLGLLGALGIEHVTATTQDKKLEGRLEKWRKKKLQQAPKAPKQPERVDEFGQQTDIKPNQHVEHSSWHNIIVDDHGREVEGAITYGQGFRQELQQENLRDVVMTGSQQQAAALPADPPSDAIDPDNVLPPEGMIAPLSLPSSHPPYQNVQQQLPYSTPSDHKNPISTPWFWVMLLLIFAAFFIALIA